MFYELAEKKWKEQVINKCRGHLRNQYFDAQSSDKAIQTLAEFCIHLFVAIYICGVTFCTISLENKITIYIYNPYLFKTLDLKTTVCSASWR